MSGLYSSDSSAPPRLTCLSSLLNQPIPWSVANWACPLIEGVIAGVAISFSV